MLLQLSAAELITFDLVQVCSGLMASDVHHIPLFSDDFLCALKNSKSCFLLKQLLLPHMTWLDHSILRQLVLASNSGEAKNMLKSFDSDVQYNCSISSYHFPHPSQLIIPLDDSEYTLVAAKCKFNFEKETLKTIVDLRTHLITNLEITDHAFQVIAIHIKHGTVYWMIPKRLRSLIEQKINKIQYELWKSGIIMLCAFPDKFFSHGLNIDMEQGPFGDVSIFVSLGTHFIVYMLKELHLSWLL